MSLHLLSSVAHRASASRTSEDVQALIAQIEQYLAEGGGPQSDRLVRISQLAVELFGPELAQQRVVSAVSLKQQQTIKSLRDAVNELRLIRDTLAIKQQVQQGQQAAAQQFQQGQIQQQVLQLQKLIEETKASFKSTTQIALGTAPGSLARQGSAAISVPIAPLSAPKTPPKITVPLRVLDVFEGEKYALNM